MFDVPTIARELLEELTEGLPEHPFAVRLWDGTVILPPTERLPRFTLTLRHPEVLHKVMRSADWRVLGEAYLRDEIDIEGDIEAVYPVAEHLQARYGTALANYSAEDLDPFTAPPSAPHTKERDAAAIEYHYDLGNEAFARILDATQNYSSASYTAEDDDLEGAQRTKMARIAGKIGLKDGDRVLDIGCGWGAVLSHVSRGYAATIDGITISRAQAEYCRQRIDREGIGDRARVAICDYREIDESTPYDKIISLGMVEHVGVDNLPIYFAKAFRLLRPGGLFALQGVSSSVTEASTQAIPFTRSYLFPDADMPYLTQYLAAAQGAGFEVRDLENLREHYAWTHRAWRRNLETHETELLGLIGRERYRAFRVLFSYATHYFLARKCSLYQFVLWRPEGPRPRDLPLRRAI